MLIQPYASPEVDQATLSEVPTMHPYVCEHLISSESLLKGEREVLICHGDRIYRLRHTNNDKLILTK